MEEKSQSASSRRYLISGRVQAVGFRAFVVRAAEDLDVTGWVRNLSDGRVEALAQATQEQLEEFGVRLRRGPSLSRVDQVEESVVDGLTAGSGFEVRPTR